MPIDVSTRISASTTPSIVANVRRRFHRHVAQRHPRGHRKPARPGNQVTPSSRRSTRRLVAHRLGRDGPRCGDRRNRRTDEPDQRSESDSHRNRGRRGRNASPCQGSPERRCSRESARRSAPYRALRRTGRRRVRSAGPAGDSDGPAGRVWHRRPSESRSRTARRAPPREQHVRRDRRSREEQQRKRDRQLREAVQVLLQRRVGRLAGAALRDVGGSRRSAVRSDRALSSDVSLTLP